MRTLRPPDAPRSPQYQGFALDDLRALALIAHAGSMSAAAARFGMSKSVLSRAVARLEGAAGGPLFERSTEGMVPTAMGEVLLPVADRAVALLRDADEAMRSAAGVPQGRLRIAASTLAGRVFLAPALAEMRRRHPLVRVAQHVTNRRPDPLAGDFDVVIQVGPPAEPYLVARRLLRSPLALYAGPAAAGTMDMGDPATVAQLGRIVIDVENVPRAWEFTDPAGQTTLFDDEPVTSVDDPMVAIDIVRSGVGVACVPELYGDPLARAGQLTRLLPGWRGRTVELYAVMPPRRTAVPAVHAFLDVLAERLSAIYGQTDPSATKARTHAR